MTLASAAHLSICRYAARLAVPDLRFGRQRRLSFVASGFGVNRAWGLGAQQNIFRARDRSEGRDVNSSSTVKTILSDLDRFPGAML